MKYTKIPALSGIDLIKLLKKDNWIEQRHSRHGVALIKSFGDRARVTIIPYTTESLPGGTLSEILGPKQTKIGKRGLLNLLNKY